ncbi:MAG: sensor histidine kinase [Desulfobulbus sp.]
MKRIKLSLGISLLLLTGISIFVANSVLLMFWAGDALQREADHLRLLLTAVGKTTSAIPSSLPKPLQSFLTDSPRSCLFWNGSHYAGERPDAVCRHGLETLLEKSVLTGTANTSLADFSLSNPVSFRYLGVIVPVRLVDNSQVFVGAGVPVSRVLHSIWEREKIVAIYIVVNTIILVSLAFLRLLKRYILPVERMVSAAETYRGEGFQVFVSNRPTDELGRLAASIHAMVQRIEADKEALNTTVKELAEKNRLLQNNQKEMVRAEKLASVGRLAAGLAHEIGNPIGVVQGYVQLLGMGDCLDQERMEYIGKALEELDRVNQLIRRLLDHARTSTGKITVFDVHDLLFEVTESLSVQPLLSNMRINLHFEATKSILCMEYEKLRQVFLNCLLNAADAVSSKWGKNEGGGEICVTTSDEVETLSLGKDANCVIVIADNGCGIPLDLLEAVFDPFFTTKEPGAGTGLGLSVSQALIESMGGRITLNSDAGKGTRIQIILPAKAGGQISADHETVNERIM